MVENKQKISLKDVTSQKPLKRSQKNKPGQSSGSRPLTSLEMKQLEEDTVQALKEAEGRFKDLK